MSNNEILEKRLQEINITYSELLKTIYCERFPSASVVVYISQMDGLGNSSSDLDIYIVSADDNEIVSQSSQLIYNLRGINIDVEYWKLTDVNSLINKLLNKDNLEQGKLKFLHRIKAGCIIYSKDVYKTEIEKCLNRFSEVDLTNCSVSNYILSTSALLDDAVKMYQNASYSSALICARSALENAIAAICAVNGYANINAKWIPQIFINNVGFGDNEFLQDYIRYQIYCSISPETIHDFLENMISFIQQILFRISLQK